MGSKQTTKTIGEPRSRLSAVECATFSWYHLDQFPIDVRDMIVRSLCCDDETTFVQAYRDMSGSYITEGEISGQAVTMLADLDDWRNTL